MLKRKLKFSEIVKMFTYEYNDEESMDVRNYFAQSIRNPKHWGYMKTFLSGQVYSHILFHPEEIKRSQLVLLMDKEQIERVEKLAIWAVMQSYEVVMTEVFQEQDDVFAIIRNTDTKEYEVVTTMNAENDAAQWLWSSIILGLDSEWTNTGDLPF